MAANFENAGQRTIEEPEQRNNIVVEFKSLLREIDDFVCKLKALEETLARHADDNEEGNMFLRVPGSFDDVTLKDYYNDQLRAAKKKELS